MEKIHEAEERKLIAGEIQELKDTLRALGPIAKLYDIKKTSGFESEDMNLATEFVLWMDKQECYTSKDIEKSKKS